MKQRLSILPITPADQDAGRHTREEHMASLLWLVFAVLIVLWLVGFAVNWGAFIWLLLIAALVALAINLLTASRSGRWY
jgi:hypothetical protein